MQRPKAALYRRRERDFPEAQKAERARVTRTPTLSYRTPSHAIAADARFVFVLISMLRLTTRSSTLCRKPQETCRKL